jgi:YVTN family beta-propeller protein
MISKPKLFSIALMSAAILLVLISIAGAYPFAYIAKTDSNSVSVINTTNNNITATVNGFRSPYAAAATTTKAYVTNYGNDTVSVIETATNTVGDTKRKRQYRFCH